jgi:Asp-tRNA(Asn)/Glu-tRNA(Gln) amidotransferase A subunit family amidase
MSNSLDTAMGRRGFLALLSAAAAGTLPVSQGTAGVQSASQDNGVTPSDDLPDITAKTIEEAEKLAGIRFTPVERSQIARTISEQVRSLSNRLQGVEMPDSLYPATLFNPVLPGHTPNPATRGGTVGSLSVRRKTLPKRDDDIGFAQIAELSHWIHTKQITCTALTQLYLKRLKQFDKLLRCVITLTPNRALRQARMLDEELIAGRSRGVLHGIPWGAKDLFDTASIPTTFGAAPFKGRIPTLDAQVVQRLDAAGAVLVAKLAMGALAYGDIWFGGRTNTPWNVEHGSSGSSAGSAAATAAGLVGFSLGTETCGSIMSPCKQCGTFGLRPTFGRVPRDGAMSLCWSLDKIGPICRGVADLGVVLAAIHGASDHDPCSVTEPLHVGSGQGVRGLRVGYDPKWFADSPDAEIYRIARESLAKSGATLVKISMPDLPWNVLFGILTAEATAAFESITRDGRDDQLTWQDPEAWPNTFRQAWFIPAPEYVQVQRFRRNVMQIYARLFQGVDALITPLDAGGTLIATNCTGHPALACPAGIGDDDMPRLVVLIGRLFDEGTLLRLGDVIESRAWARRRPPIGQN